MFLPTASHTYLNPEAGPYTLPLPRDTRTQEPFLQSPVAKRERLVACLVLDSKKQGRA